LQVEENLARLQPDPNQPAMRNAAAAFVKRSLSSKLSFISKVKPFHKLRESALCCVW
jgi:hypothetical protein